MILLCNHLATIPKSHSRTAGKTEFHESAKSIPSVPCCPPPDQGDAMTSTTEYTRITVARETLPRGCWCWRPTMSWPISFRSSVSWSQLMGFGVGYEAPVCAGGYRSGSFRWHQLCSYLKTKVNLSNHNIPLSRIQQDLFLPQRWP